MSNYQKLFCAEVLTPAGKVLGVEAVSAIVPLEDGLLGVLADRAPLVGKMGAGQLTIEQPGGVVHKFFVAGGFAHVGVNALSVLVEQCEPADKVTAEQAAEELKQAEALPIETGAQKERRRNAVAVASAKLRLTRGRTT